MINIKKSALLTTLVILMMSSCVIDVRHDIRVKNSTSDSLYFGVSEYNNIDSVHYILIPDRKITDICDDTMNVSLWNGMNVRELAVYPDSMCSNGSITLFGDRDTGYVFVIKRQIARTYSFDDIRKRKLYEKVMVTKNKRDQGFCIEYKGKEHLAKTISD